MPQRVVGLAVEECTAAGLKRMDVEELVGVDGLELVPGVGSVEPPAFVVLARTLRVGRFGPVPSEEQEQA
jgi:hypothetical protein